MSFRLTREVRFALNDLPDDQLSHPPTNSFAGYPSLTGFGQHLAIQVTLEGKLDPKSGYLRNIKEIDRAVLEQLIPEIGGRIGLVRKGHKDLGFSSLPSGEFSVLRGLFPGDTLHSTTLCLTPHLSITQLASEHGMYTRLSQKFEFSAAHRLHNSALSDEENHSIYGKCNSPNGHGHNYVLQVTLRGKPNDSGLLVELPAMEKIVSEFAIQKLDHKNLNHDVPEFRELIPTVENIAMVIFRMLKSRFAGIGAELASVTVWETSKTWCEYSEE